MKPTRLPKSGAGFGHDFFKDEETKTLCPACRGSCVQEIAAVAPSQYRIVKCVYCEGAGLVTATRASAWRMRAVLAS